MSRVKIYDRPGALLRWWRAWGWILLTLLALAAGGLVAQRMFGWS
jgi:hypothetical protein